MKRQNSPDFRLGKNTNNQNTFLRIQPFSKTFKKKYQAYESPSINSTVNLMKTFSKNKIREQKRSPYQKQSPGKKIERRSTSKNRIESNTEKTSLTYHGYQQSHMSTTSKLILVNNIFGRKALTNEPKELISRFYQYNEQYLEILCQWQKMEMYDEVDKLIYKLTQNYMRLMEDIITKTFLPLSSKLQKYEQCINQLMEQNSKLKTEVKSIQQKQTAFSILYENLRQQFQKNQWSNLILGQIAKTFNLQSFVQNTDFFNKMMGECGTNKASSQLVTNSCILPSRNLQFCNNQKREQPLESNKSDSKHVHKVKSAANIIQNTCFQ